MKLDYTFHSHTYRCGHADGDIEDYVKVAFANGFKIYGVSDHVFLPGVPGSHMRGDYSLFDEYISTFNIVKQEHKNDIEMYLAFECEYSDYYYAYYRSLLKDKKFDYLICGQHIGFDDEGKSYSYFNGDPIHDAVGIIKYRDDLIKAMKSGLFLYIAHPDFFFDKVIEIGDIHKQITKEIIDAAIKYDVVFEINLHGFVRNVTHKYISYPCDYFWEQVSKTNIKVILGGDFHTPTEIENIAAISQVEQMVKKYDIHLSDIKTIYSDYRKSIEKII